MGIESRGFEMKFNIMVCRQCEDKWFMDDDYEQTNPEVMHCENCGASGLDIKSIVWETKS
jgi:hypothetical protein